MILSQLSDYITQRQRVSLVDMTHRFDADAEALRAMLTVLERKGRVRKLTAAASCTCNGCGKCGRISPEFYEATGRQDTPLSH
jgi:hypothetical protein